MRRRKFITLLGGAAAAWPLAARAQQPTMPVIGFLSSASAGPGRGPCSAAFRQGLSETGYVEGRNVAIEYRWAEEQIRSVAGAGGRSGRRQVAVIVQAGQVFGGLGCQGRDCDHPDRLSHRRSIRSHSGSSPA